jgi:hypothetical protein
MIRRTPLRRLALAGLAGLSLAAAAPVAAAPASGPIAYAACTRATIGGAPKCIARGQFCAVRYARDYRRYGLSCTYRDANGRYHLR